MNEAERIIEVTGYSEPVRITWHKDPTRHLLKASAVNANCKSIDARPSPLEKPSKGKRESRASED